MIVFFTAFNHATLTAIGGASYCRYYDYWHFFLSSSALLCYYLPPLLLCSLTCLILIRFSDAFARATSVVALRSWVLARHDLSDRKLCGSQGMCIRLNASDESGWPY